MSTPPPRLRAVVNTRTGETEYIPYTPEEEAAREAEEVLAVQIMALNDTALSNEKKMQDQIRQAAVEMLALARAIEDGSATNADRNRAAVLCLRGTVRLAKIVFDDLTEEV